MNNLIAESIQIINPVNNRTTGMEPNIKIDRSILSTPLNPKAIKSRQNKNVQMYQYMLDKKSVRSMYPHAPAGSQLQPSTEPVHLAHLQQVINELNRDQKIPLLNQPKKMTSHNSYVVSGQQIESQKAIPKFDKIMISSKQRWNRN